MIVRDENKNEYLIEKVAGTGGQGAVFLVENDNRIVIKAITNPDGQIIQNKEKYKQYRDTVLRVISKANFNNLASPICMLESPYCGYVMRFMEGMEKIENIMMPKKEKLAEFYTKTGGIKKRYYVLREIARVLNDLYNNGLVYADISPKNIYVSKNKEDYEAWLIDVDNLHFQGDEKMCIGTPMYRAPEVFNGYPNTIKSDVYSFALLAFELLTLSKPFEGDYQEDMEEDDWGVEEDDSSDDFYSKLERGDIPFVGSEKDKRNVQISGIPFDYVMNDEIKKLFVQTFEDGRNNPAKRPSISRWLDELNKICDSISQSSCGHYNIKKRCFLCGKEDEKIRVDCYRMNYFFVDDENANQEKEKICSIRVDEQSKLGIKLPDYLFVDKPLDKDINYFVELIRRNQKWEMCSSLNGVKIHFNRKEIKSLDNLIMYVEKDNIITRQIEFFREK